MNISGFIRRSLEIYLNYFVKQIANRLLSLPTCLEYGYKPGHNYYLFGLHSISLEKCFVKFLEISRRGLCSRGVSARTIDSL